MTWLLDLDGVVWRGETPISGSPEALRKLASQGREIYYVTNNSALTARGYAEKLHHMSAPGEPENVIHAGFAVAEVVEDNERVLVCGGPGLVEGLKEKGEVINVDDVHGKPPRVDVVALGFRSDFCLEWLNMAAVAVMNGARLVAPSADRLYPDDYSYRLGGGSLSAAVAHATGVTPVVAGKPYQPMANVVRARVPHIEMFVGDQRETDGKMAAQLGAQFAWVKTGVPSAPNSNAESVSVAMEATNLAEVVDMWLSIMDS